MLRYRWRGVVQAAPGTPGMGMLSILCLLWCCVCGEAAMGHLHLKPHTLIPLFSGLSCNSVCAICVFSDWTWKVGILLQLTYMTHICMDPVQKKRKVQHKQQGALISLTWRSQLWWLSNLCWIGCKLWPACALWKFSEQKEKRRLTFTSMLVELKFKQVCKCSTYLSSHLIFEVVGCACAVGGKFRVSPAAFFS